MEFKNLKYIITVIVVGILLYITYPLYDASTPFMGQAPVLWLVLPFVIAAGVYLLLSQDRAYIDKIASLAKTGEQTVPLVEPMICWDRFANMEEYSQLGAIIGRLSWIKLVDHWLFIVPTIEGKRYLFFNGLPNQPLNPEIIDRSEMRDIGFEDVKDKERSGKSRLLYDIIRNGRFTPDRLSQLMGEGGSLNEL